IFASGAYGWQSVDLYTAPFDSAVENGDPEAFELVADEGAFGEYGHIIVEYMRDNAAADDIHWDVLAGYHRHLYESHPQAYQQIPIARMGRNYYHQAVVDNQWWSNLPGNYRWNSVEQLFNDPDRFIETLSLMIDYYIKGIVPQRPLRLTSRHKDTIKDIFSQFGTDMQNISLQPDSFVILNGSKMQFADGSTLRLNGSVGAARHELHEGQGGIRIDDMYIEAGDVRRFGSQTGIARADRTSFMFKGQKFLAENLTELLLDKNTVRLASAEVAQFSSIRLKEANGMHFTSSGGSTTIRTGPTTGMEYVQPLFGERFHFPPIAGANLTLDSSGRLEEIQVLPQGVQTYVFPAAFSCSKEDGGRSFHNEVAVHGNDGFSIRYQDGSMDFSTSGKSVLSMGSINVTSAGEGDNRLRILDDQDCYGMEIANQNLSLGPHLISAENNASLNFSQERLDCVRIEATGRYTNKDHRLAAYVPVSAGHFRVCMDDGKQAPPACMEQCGVLKTREGRFLSLGIVELETPHALLGIYDDIFRARTSAVSASYQTRPGFLQVDTPSTTGLTSEAFSHRFGIREYRGSLPLTTINIISTSAPGTMATYKSSPTWSEIAVEEEILRYSHETTELSIYTPHTDRAQERLDAIRQDMEVQS
ncbi:MAG: hypothetical protein ACOCWQ_03600, partial [Nanoarchaeota archaeon]